jgi:hypothetical protein
MNIRSGLIPGCIAIILAALAYAQMQDTYENLDFAHGTIGEMPPGWNLGPRGTMVHTAKIIARASCNGGSQCAELDSLGGDSSRCFLYQNFAAAPYREKFVRFRATVRADVAKGAFANLLVRVHRTDNSTSFYNDMANSPITSKSWIVYEIVGPVDKDARDIEFGVQLHGKGSAWIDRITLDFLTSK